MIFNIVLITYKKDLKCEEINRFNKPLNRTVIVAVDKNNSISNNILKLREIMVYMVKHDVCTYDEYADALFIAQPVDYVYDKVIELEDDILLEVDVKKIPRALEILNAPNHFNISKSELNNIVKLSMGIDITGNNITINVILTVKNAAEFEFFF